MNSNIYDDIARRTGGDIYIGVVGPVRTGKSTFISRFVSKLVLPKIENEDERKRTIDELPQSADGKMVMTTQPKFVPNKGVEILTDNKCSAKVRLVDCVGFWVDGAEGWADGDDKARLVNTPWDSEPMSFDKAATIGTQKVVSEHSTVAVVITTDGTIGTLPRASYVKAEETAVSELKKTGKPFVVVLNSTQPQSEETLGLARILEERYGAKVLCLDVANANEEDFEVVLYELLKKFPVRRIAVDLPQWMRALDVNNSAIVQVTDCVKELAMQINDMNDCAIAPEVLKKCPFVESATIGEMDMGSGTLVVKVQVESGLFFRVLSEEAKEDIADEFSLMSYVANCSKFKARFAGMEDALDEADKTGYGIVGPQFDNLILDEPQMVKQGNVYGVRLIATAPSYHVVRVNVSTEVSPMVGSEQQSKYLLDEYKQNPEAIWNANMFGKTMSGLANDGLENKCTSMPVEIKQKLCKTINRIVNENKGGLLCFLL